MAKVIVGMSGGVDSSAAALLLKEAGYDVVGVTLRTWSSQAYSRCCEIDDARAVARKLGIPFHALNCVSPFQRQVLEPFADCYFHGLTPNPCVACNRFVKWDRMLHTAALLGADYVATGHYASLVRLDNGRYSVRQAADERKDQTYMLCRLTQEQLARTLLPLGGYTKEEIRALANHAGLPAAQKPDSQEICFVTEGDYGDYLERAFLQEVPGEGNFVDRDGTVLGRHRGIHHYTVGQRRGLGLSLGRPVYVNRIRARENEVVVGDAALLYRREILCRRLHFMGLPDLPPGDPVRARVKIRYHHEGEEGILTREGPDLIRVSFVRPVRAPAPGQAAVFYDEDRSVLGCGEIAPV